MKHLLTIVVVSTVLHCSCDAPHPVHPDAKPAPQINVPKPAAAPPTSRSSALQLTLRPRPTEKSETDHDPGAIKYVTFEKVRGFGRLLVTSCGAYCPPQFANGGGIGIWRWPSLQLAAGLDGGVDEEYATPIGGEFSPDGSRFVAGSHDYLMLWSTTDWKRLARIKLWTVYGNYRFSRDSSVIVANNVYGQVMLIDAKTGGVLIDHKANLAEPTRGIRYAQDPSGRLLVAVDLNGFVDLWDLKARTRRLLKGAVAGSATFSPDGRQFALADENRAIVQLWDTASVKLSRTLTGAKRKNSYIYSEDHDARLIFTPDGKKLVVVYGDCEVRVWDLKTKKERIVRSQWEKPCRATVADDTSHVAVAIPAHPKLYELFVYGVHSGSAYPLGTLATYTIRNLKLNEDTLEIIYEVWGSEEKDPRPWKRRWSFKTKTATAPTRHTPAPENVVDGTVVRADGDLYLTRSDGRNIIVRMVGGSPRRRLVVDPKFGWVGDEQLAQDELLERQKPIKSSRLVELEHPNLLAEFVAGR